MICLPSPNSSARTPLPALQHEAGTSNAKASASGLEHGEEENRTDDEVVDVCDEGDDKPENEDAEDEDEGPAEDEGAAEDECLEDEGLDSQNEQDGEFEEEDFKKGTYKDTNLSTLTCWSTIQEFNV